MRTKIVATIGPVCADERILLSMIREGVAIFRFNFSHGTLEDHEHLYQLLGRAQKRAGHRVAVLQDLAGHRIRTGKLRQGKPVALRQGQRFWLYRKPVLGSSKGVSLDYPGSFEPFQRGTMIYIADGSIHLQVRRRSQDKLETVVIQEGMLEERKGVNIPNVLLEFPPISVKDVLDLDFAIRHEVDYVAQSFARSAADVIAVRRRLSHAWPRCKVIAKIENQDGRSGCDRSQKAPLACLAAL
ncbi:MAG: hypothetical protein HYT88_07430 [Candidatus Omnitrophica bacterium]|nr:hypothetical protein [Candidatus Omnitrophota bacterium]